jgi:hypothetical protein
LCFRIKGENSTPNRMADGVSHTNYALGFIMCYMIAGKSSWRLKSLETFQAWIMNGLNEMNGKLETKLIKIS